ncbi:GNAT family N-acetyltransferase [Nocardia yunnanensis]|uniref:GNAT family N-acetyltransferase n=1 Tax=Nocardia yunnanensis TaxID=2382165 RepID=A0A386ZLR5_9NOCA|nr:GNAT family N-acetyltransferase [Nocardia yunnanensis]AYF78243.1 GNAT family N-acetyltransferase [Nocardia yunnanensis]
MPLLTPPTVTLHAAWLEAHDEWGPGLHEDGFGLHASDDVDSPTGFATWVATLTAAPTTTNPCTYYWITDGPRVLGGIALRHHPTEYGHIGYGIRPTARRQGIATWALAAILPHARALGLPHVLLVCEPHNLPSIRTIERNGGIPDPTTPPDLRRYRINLRPRSSATLPHP